MSEEACAEFVLGNPTSQFLLVRALRRTHPECTDYWDGNWITCRLEVRAGAFRGKVDADLRAEEFVFFENQLSELNATLAGHAKFTTLEGWLHIDLSVDRLGHVTATCELLDQPGIGNCLTCKLELDQTFLPPVLAGLRAIISAFPVLDAPAK